MCVASNLFIAALTVTVILTTELLNSQAENCYATTTHGSCHVISGGTIIHIYMMKHSNK